jgi:c-di-GMP-binding flagellar brake protein YcgR
MNHSPLSINDSVEVLVQEGEKRTGCSSSVFDIVDGHFQLNWPTRDGIRIPVRKDQEVSLIYFRDDATYSIRGAVQSVQVQPVPTIRFRPLEDVERIQRREYCRVRASLPVLLVEALSRAAAGPGAPKGINITTRTIDISGSGMRIHVDAPVPPGTVFRVKLGLEPDQPPVDLTARAVYSGSLPPANGRAMYRIGIEFTAVTEPKRRRIVRHVFKIQQATIAGTPEAPKTAEPSAGPRPEAPKP